MRDRLQDPRTHAAVVLLERDLRLGLQLLRENKSANTHLLRMRGETTREGRKPSGVNDDIVVGEGNDRPTRGIQPAVSLPRHLQSAAPSTGEPVECARPTRPTPTFVAPVVDNEHLKVRAIERRQRVQTLTEVLAALERGAHDHRYPRRGLRQRQGTRGASLQGQLAEVCCQVSARDPVADKRQLDQAARGSPPTRASSQTP